MDWSKLKLSPGDKILKVHAFTYLSSGATYSLEVNEFSDGTFAGHGSHAADSSQQLNSVVRDGVEACIQALVDDIQKGSGK